MAVRPEDRYPTPQALTSAMFGFLSLAAESREVAAPSSAPLATPSEVARPKSGRILVVDDDDQVGEFCALVLAAEG